MGQADIINFLEEMDGKPVCVRQIAEAIQEKPEQVSNRIKVLIKWKEVKFIEPDRMKSAELLGTERITRRMRFFYV